MKSVAKVFALHFSQLHSLPPQYDNLWATGRVVGNREVGRPYARYARGESHLDGTARAPEQQRPTVVGFREISAAGADNGNGHGKASAARIGQHHGSRRAAGAHGLTAKGKGSGGEQNLWSL